MKRPHRLGSAQPAFLRMKSRLGQESPVRTAILFIPFLLVIILSLFIGLETSTRLYSNAKPMVHPSKPMPDHEIWLSIAVRAGRLEVSTQDGTTFSWAAAGPTQDEYNHFQKFLGTKSHKLVSDLIRTGQIGPHQAVAALSVDQSLTYQHVRPVIYALAASGFSKYGFETRVLK